MRIIGIVMIVLGGLMMAGSMTADVISSDSLAWAALAGRQAAVTCGGFVFLAGWVALSAAAIRIAIRDGR